MFKLPARRAFGSFLGAALMVCAAPIGAHAAPADEAAQLADFFKGTLEIANPSGNWSAKRHLAPDHTYRETGSDGPVHGKWAVKDGKICTTDDELLGVDRAETYCNTGVGKKAGESWKDSDPVTGNAVLFKLTASR